MPLAIRFFKSFDKEEGLIAEAHDSHGSHHHQDAEEEQIINFSHPNFHEK